MELRVANFRVVLNLKQVATVKAEEHATEATGCNRKTECEAA